MLQFKAPNDLHTLSNSHPAYPLVQDLVSQSPDCQFLGRPPLLPALGRQRQATSSAPQHLESGLDHEWKFGDAGRTVR